MNTPGLRTSLTIFKQIGLNRQSLSFTTIISNRKCSQNVSYRPNKNRRNQNVSIKPEYHGSYQKKKIFRDSEISTYISSSKSDPESFGTLSDDWKLHQKLSSLPDEDDDVVETEFLHNKQGKNRLTTNKYGKIIKKFIKQKKISNAIDVMETRMLKEDRASPDNYIYNLLIAACGQVGYTQKAFSLYTQMKKRQLTVTKHTYTSLFNACANSPYPEDALKRAMHLKNILLERGVLMNPVIYHSMIKAFGRCGDLETAFMIVDEMLEKKIPVSGDTFNFLLQACITDKTAGFRHALLVWHKMSQKRVRPTLFSFNLLLRCSRDCGLGDDVATNQVIQVLLQSGQKSSNRKLVGEGGSTPQSQSESRVAVACSGDDVPNLISRQPTMGSVVAFNGITQPEHRLMLMGGCRGVLEQMRLSQVKPDIKTFTQLLDQMPSTMESELELLDAVKQNDISLDVDFCNMLIRKRCLRKDYENAKLILSLIQEQGLRPDIMTFGVLAMTGQTPASSRQLLTDMEKLGYRPNIEILGTLVKNACYSRNVDFIVEILQVMEKEELKPNEKFIKHLDNFDHFASNASKQQAKDDRSLMRLERMNDFREYYQYWRQAIKLEEPPEPWAQFKEKFTEPEDVELMNYGRVKYVK